MQPKFINKLYAVAVEHCMPVISMDEAQKVSKKLFSFLLKIQNSIQMKCFIFLRNLTMLKLQTIFKPSQKINKT